MDDQVFRSLLQVDPAENGHGMKQKLLWDGEDAGLIEANFQGQDVSTEVGFISLLRDVDELIALAVKGKLQIVQIDLLLIEQLRAKVNG